MNALRLRVRRGTTVRVYDVRCRIDSAAELAYLAHGGVLRYMVGRALSAGGAGGRAVSAMSP